MGRSQAVWLRNAANGFAFYSTNILTLSVTGNQAVSRAQASESVNGVHGCPFNFTVTVQDVNRLRHVQNRRFQTRANDGGQHHKRRSSAEPSNSSSLRIEKL